MLDARTKNHNITYNYECITFFACPFSRNKPATEEEVSEKDKHEKLIGQLKAAEARNRIRIMRLRYESNRVNTVSIFLLAYFDNNFILNLRGRTYLWL